MLILVGAQFQKPVGMLGGQGHQTEGGGTKGKKEGPRRRSFEDEPIPLELGELIQVLTATATGWLGALEGRIGRKI